VYQPSTDAARGRLTGLPGSPGGLLAAWLGAWLAGRVSSDDMLAAVQVGDAPHRVVGLDGEAGPVPFARVLPHVRRLGPAAVQLRMPVPGDVDGLSGPLLAAALEAGEVVVISPHDPRRTGLVLLPRRDVRGSAIEPLVTVAWEARPSDARPGHGPGAPSGLREAERGLAAAVAEAAATLVDIGQVSRLSPQAQAAIRALRDRQGAPLGLPAGSPPEAVRVLTTAERLAAVVELAVDNQPLSAAADARRAAALRQVATAVRHARRYAYTACADGSTPTGQA